MSQKTVKDEKTLKKEIRSWLKNHYYDYDPHDPNYTTIAENCAHDLDHDEWLDDPDHFIWDEVLDHYKEC